jgi:hypothetical protein
MDNRRDTQECIDQNSGVITADATRRETFDFTAEAFERVGVDSGV